MLLSGEAELIGDENGKFHAQDLRGNAVARRSRAHSRPTRSGHPHRTASRRFQDAGAGRDRASHRAWRAEAAAALPDRRLRSCAQLEAATAFAPLHIPAALSVIRFAQEHFPGLPQVGLLRHDLSRRTAGRRARSSAPQGTAGGGHPALRVSWPFMRIHRAPTRRRSARPPDHRPSRQRRERHRRQRRKVHRHQHGADPDRRRDHGHAQRRSRSGCSGLSGAREEIRRGHARRSGRSPFRPSRRFRRR